MAHRRARKDARKAERHFTESLSSNLDDTVQIVDVPVVTLRKPPQPRSDKRTLKLLGISRRAGGVGLTKQHPIATKPARRAAAKKARASRKSNRG